MLPTSELLPGMVVAKDLLAQESIVLLGNDHVLTDKLIRLLRLREVRDGVTFMLAVKLEAKP
jgi:hypothetical protein